MKENTKINLKCQFPIVDLGQVQYKHTKVRKASVPGYIALTYISRWPNRNATMAQCLAEAGISGDMTQIVCNEVFDFCFDSRLKILETNESHDTFKQRFLDMKIRDLNLTADGEKLFRDQYIPSGEKRVNRKQVFFNIAQDKYTLEHKNVAGESLLPAEKFQHDAETKVTESSVKDYLVSIATALGIEKEERITAVLDFDSTIKFINIDVVIEITPNGASFTSQDPAYVNFLTERYSSSELSSIIQNEVGRWLFVPDIALHLEDLDNYVRIIKVSDAGKLATRNCAKMVLGGRIKEGENKAWADLLLRCLPGFDAMSVEHDGSIHAFQAVRLEVNPVGMLGNTFEMDVLVETIVDDEKANEIYHDIVHLLVAQSINENGNLIKCMIAKGFVPNVQDFAWQKIIAASNDGEGIDIFVELCKLLAKEPKWKDPKNQIADKLLEQCTQGTTSENIISKAYTIRRFASQVGIEEKTIAQKLLDGMSQTITEDRKFDLLLGAKFSEKIALSLTNPIIPYIESVIAGKEIIADNSIARKFNSLAGKLSVLKNMLGIEDDPYEYIHKPITDVNSFKATEKSFVYEYGNLKSQYSIYASEQWKILDGFHKAIVDANNLLLLSEKPVTEYSRQDFENLANSDSNQCLVNLATRAEAELRRVLRKPAKDASPLATLLNEAKDNISKGDYEILDNLRALRNEQLHKAEMNGQNIDMKAAIDCVFRIVAINNKKK